MKYLCDTHILLWWLNNDKRLKDSIKNILTDSHNIILVSVVSAWEIIIKLRTNSKFRLKTTVYECFQKSGFEILNVQLAHVLQIEKLPNFHQDPFDHILIAQAVAENATLISGDKKIWKYKIDLLKA